MVRSGTSEMGDVRSWGRGGGGAAVPAGDPAPLLPQSVIRLDRNRNCPPPPPQADGHMWSSPSSGRAGGTPDPCPAPATPPPPDSAVASVHSVNSTQHYLDSGFGYRQSHMISEVSQCKKSEQYLFPSPLCSQ